MKWKYINWSRLVENISWNTDKRTHKEYYNEEKKFTEHENINIIGIFGEKERQNLTVTFKEIFLWEFLVIN